MLDFPNPSGKKWHRADVEEQPTSKAVEDIAMSDPYERDETEIRYVTVEHVTRKRVPDYEAELLSRHGWKIIEDA